MSYSSIESLSGNCSYDNSLFSETPYCNSQYSPSSNSSCQSTPPSMSVKSHEGRSLKRSTKMLDQRSTPAIQLESPSYDSQSPWTADQYALVAAAAMPVSPNQPQTQHMQASNVPLYNLNNYQQPAMDKSALVPDPPNDIHKDHYEFEFTKKKGSFFRLKEECCSEHPSSWPETIPVVPYEDPETGKVRQVCYYDDCPSSFKRPYDLFRHYNTVHGKVSIPCDYKKCGSGIEKAFNRIDHARDHYREYHKEDLVKRCKKDETKAEKVEKWRERQPQKGGKLGLWWRCTACLKRNPWNRNMNKDEPWKCEDKDCHKECELERKIWRLEGVEAVLVYLKLVPAKSAPAESKYGIRFPKGPKKTIRRVTKKIKTENSSPLLPSPPMPDDIPSQASPSLSIPASPKRPGTDRIFTDTGKKIRKVAAMDNLRDTAASAEELPSYYHMPSFDEVPSATEQMQVNDVPFSSSPLVDTTSLPDINVPSTCTAVVHPDVKGCDSCLSGWRLNGRLTACDTCNAHGCVCDASSRASSQKSQSHHSPSLHSSSRSTDGRSPKRQRTSGSCPSTPINTQSLSRPSYETWNGFSPAHNSILSFFATSTEAHNDISQHPWDDSHETLVQNGSPVHPGFLTPRNNTPSETRSSEKHISPNLHSGSWPSSSPVQSALLKEFEEYPSEEGMDEGLLVVSQFNDEWDVINYPSS